MTTAEECSLSTGPMLPGFETCEIAEPTTLSPLTSSAEASPASPSRSRVVVVPRQTSDGSGPSFSECLGYFDPDTSSLKMCQASLTEGSVTFSRGLPRWGLMRNGRVYRRPPSVRLISERGSLLLLTPLASDAAVARSLTADMTFRITRGGTPRKISRAGKDGSVGLTRLIKLALLPTPTAREGRTLKGARDRPNRVGGPSLAQVMLSAGWNQGFLNPSFVEWMMGYPPLWTDLEG